MDFVSLGPITDGPEQLEREARAAISSLPTPPALAILYCRIVARDLGESVEAFVGETKHPVLGMACYGEMLRVGGTADGFYNTTAIVAAW